MQKDTSTGIIPFFTKNTGELSFLVIQHTAGHWSFPKGHQEQKEELQETALREFKEETGITKCDILETTPFITTYVIPEEKETHYKKKGEPQEKTVIYFLGRVSDTSVSLNTSSNEIIDYAWLPYKEALKKITYKEPRNVLKKAFTHLKSSI